MTIDAFPVLAWSCQPDGAATFFSRRWLEFTGLSAGDAWGSGWRSALHPGDAPGFMAAWSTLLSSGCRGEPEARLRRSDGVYRWFAFRAAPESGPNGEIAGFQCVCLEIESRKRAESLLSAKKRILELITGGASLTEILDNLCREIDEHWPEASSTILLMDEGGRRLWPAAGPRVSPGWMKKISPLEVGPCAGSCGTAAFLNQTVISKDIATDPLWNVYRDDALGHGLHASWSQPLTSRSGAVIGTFAMYYSEPRTPDASDLELIEGAAWLAAVAIEGGRTEEALRRSEREWREIVEAIPQLITVLDPNGATLHVNRPVLEFTGLPLEEIRDGALATHAIHPDDRTRVGQEARNAFAAGTPFRTEHRIRGRDGNYRWFLNWFNPLRDDRGQVVRWYVTGIDIEDRKRTEERIRNENVALREEISQARMDEEIVGSSKKLSQVLRDVRKVAPTDSTVLILGETGTGKELIARAIHRHSQRAARPFIRVNCAAIPQALVASELFGHEKGAFTGALERRIGRFEAAEGGTIFLDEAGELPAETQVALLRVLQEREFERVGSSRPIRADVRVLAASNRDLQQAVAAGEFRPDLYYRLNVFPVHIPPLRERRDDLVLLLEYFLDRFSKKAGKRIGEIGSETLRLIQEYDWPGNIRELQNVIERAVILWDGGPFSIDPSWLKLSSPAASAARLAKALQRPSGGEERKLIEAALEECKGRISGPSGAAIRLGIPRQTLESKIAALGIDRYRFKRSQ